jgi:death-on-curing family protein
VTLFSLIIGKSYRFIHRVCHVLGKKNKFFKNLDQLFVDIEKNIRLYLFISEYLSKGKFHFTIVNAIKYPTVGTIKELHDFLVIKYQSDKDKIHGGELSLAPLEFSGIKYYLASKSDRKEDIIYRGAFIFNKFLEEGHPFIDGNKRTGWVTLWLFLAANGYIFSFPPRLEGSKQAQKVEEWANFKEESNNINEIVDWIRKYVKEKK